MEDRKNKNVQTADNNFQVAPTGSSMSQELNLFHQKIHHKVVGKGLNCLTDELLSAYPLFCVHASGAHVSMRVTLGVSP